MRSSFRAAFGGWMALLSTSCLTEFALAQIERSSISAWGDNNDGQCDVPPPNVDFAAVAAGAQHSLGLKTDGSIRAWGVDFQPPPSPNSEFVAIAAGWSHSVALKASGAIVAWGQGYHGECFVPSPNSGFGAIAAGGG